MTRLSDGADAEQIAAAMKNVVIRQRKVFEEDGWCLFKWEDNSDYYATLERQYVMLHNCGIDKPHAVRERNGIQTCVRCEEAAPEGLIALYEMSNWDGFGYGG